MVEWKKLIDLERLKAVIETKKVRMTEWKRLAELERLSKEARKILHEDEGPDHILRLQRARELLRKALDVVLRGDDGDKGS